jgi:predicted nucleic acid-binding protein
LASDALQVAITHSISAYDACYVALSHRLGLPLVTADDALIRKLTGAPFTILRLADLSFPSTS